jgi:hypothetical protein
MFGKSKNAKVEKPLGTYSMKHIAGLEIPQTSCLVKVFFNRIEIISGAKEFNLKIEKLVGVDFDLNVDVERYVKPSSLKEVLNKPIFGAQGTVVTSAPMNKAVRNVTTKAAVGYQSSDGEIAYIVFEDNAPNTQQTAKFIDKIRPLIKTDTMRSKIEL